jgi:hypothetical protein
MWWPRRRRASLPRGTFAHGRHSTIDRRFGLTSSCRQGSVNYDSGSLPRMAVERHALGWWERHRSTTRDSARMNLRQEVKRWLRDRGGEVFVPRRNRVRNARFVRLERFRLPDDVPVDEAKGTMTVPLDKMVSRAAFPFGPDGWHPYVAALEQQLDDPSLAYRDTVLHAFYARFQPETVHDFLLDGFDVARSNLASWPSADDLIDIWSATAAMVQEHRLKFEHTRVLPHSEYRGPTPDEYGARHLERCLEFYNSLPEHGYQPSAIGDRYVAGYFLTRDDDYRFVVGHGNHRLAAMRVRGFTDLEVTFRLNHPTVIAEKRLHRWTWERGGLLEPEEARAVFDRFFVDDSKDRAAALGLL